MSRAFRLSRSLSMTGSAAALALLSRICSRALRNHHLYNNNGTWWCHYTEHHSDFTKQRIRMSLQTPSLPAARAKRDRWFSEIQAPIV